MVDRSTVANLSLSSKTYTVSGQTSITASECKAGMNSKLMGTITFPSAPFCIYRAPATVAGNTKLCTGVIPTGISVTKKSGGNNYQYYQYTIYSGTTTSLPAPALCVFPSLGVTIEADEYGSQQTARPYMTISSSKFTSYSTTPLGWQTYALLGDSSYGSVSWTLHFSSDLKTGYIYVHLECAEVYGALYTPCLIDKITSPTSITFDKIAF